MPWSFVESVPGQWNWQQFDKEYSATVAGGLRPLMVAFAAPCWARANTNCNDALYTGPPDPAHEPDWTDYVRRLTARYPAAIGIEIWNEPNLDALFWPHADPIRFTRLLKEAYAAIKALRPALPVISGGLLSSPLTDAEPGGTGDRPFLAAMYAAGAGSSMDAIGVHPYPEYYGPGPKRWDPSVFNGWLQQLRGVRDAASASQPIWITEVGESTATEPGSPPAVSPAAQAADLLAMVRSAAASPDVRVLIIHRLLDEALDLPVTLLDNLAEPLLGYNLSFNQVNTGFGVFAADSTPKPAACALARQFHGSLAC